MKDVLLNLLCEIGIDVDYNEDDFDLSEFIIDSVQFISLIVEIENVLGFELPDEFLLLDKYRSFNALCIALTDIRNHKEITREEVDNDEERT